MRIRLLTGVFILAFLYCFSATGQEIVSLLPSREDLNGWSIRKGPEIFEGDKLFDLIDGGADLYFEYGFTRVVSVDYFDQAQNITEAEIYEMTDASAAYGIFSLAQQSADWSISYGQLSVITNDYIAFWKSKYYVIISWSSRQDAGYKPMETLARLINEAIQDNGNYPDLLASFSALDPDKKAVFLRGNLALSNFYYFDYKNIFEVDIAIACTPGDHHRIVFRYADGIKSLSVLASAKQSVIANKRFTDVAMVYQGFTCKDNKGNQIMVRQEDRYIIVLVSLKQGTSLTPLLDDIILKIEELNKQ